MERCIPELPGLQVAVDILLLQEEADDFGVVIVRSLLSERSERRLMRDTWHVVSFSEFGCRR